MNLITALVQANEQRLDSLHTHDEIAYVEHCATFTRLLEYLPQEHERWSDIRILRTSPTVMVLTAGHQPDADRAGNACGWDEYEIVVRSTFDGKLQLTVTSEYGQYGDEICLFLHDCLTQEID